MMTAHISANSKEIQLNDYETHRGLYLDLSGCFKGRYGIESIRSYPGVTLGFTPNDRGTVDVTETDAPTIRVVYGVIETATTRNALFSRLREIGEIPNIVKHGEVEENGERKTANLSEVIDLDIGDLSVDHVPEDINDGYEIDYKVTATIKTTEFYSMREWQE